MPKQEEMFDSNHCILRPALYSMCATVCQQVLVIMTYLHCLFWLLTKEPELGHERRQGGGG